MISGKVEVSVLDREGDGVITTISAAASPNFQNIVLPINSFAAAGDLVLKNGDKAAASEGVLESIRIAARNGPTAACHANSALQKLPAP